MADENVLDTRPKGTIVAIFTPPWWVDMAAAKNGSILQVHHPEHGWLAFVFPPEHATLLGVTLVKHSALCEYFAGTLPADNVTRGQFSTDPYRLRDAINFYFARDTLSKKAEQENTSNL